MCDGMPCNTPGCLWNDDWHGRKITARIVDRIDYTPCEIEYTDAETGEVVGYWAYGYFDPSLPYCPPWEARTAYEKEIQNV